MRDIGNYAGAIAIAVIAIGVAVVAIVWMKPPTYLSTLLSLIVMILMVLATVRFLHKREKGPQEPGQRAPSERSRKKGRQRDPDEGPATTEAHDPVEARSAALAHTWTATRPSPTGRPERSETSRAPRQARPKRGWWLRVRTSRFDKATEQTDVKDSAPVATTGETPRLPAVRPVPEVQERPVPRKPGHPRPAAGLA